ncbi:MAG: hypothetical protein RLZZ182_2545 [Pseudomonadota bacterium]
MKTVIQTDPGVQAVFGLQDGNLITGTVQDCDPIAEYAKAKHNAGMYGSSDMKHAASVPRVFVEKYLNDAGITYAEFAASQEHKRRLLNDPAIAHFRIWKGQV